MAELDGKTVMVLMCSVLVFLMTLPGLALFYGSLVSRKNLLDTLLQSVLICATLPMTWWLIGYSFSFDDTPHVLGDYVGGLGRAQLEFNSSAVYADVPESAWCLFQLTFGVITAAIACGAVAERVLLWPIVWFSNAWLLVVYAPVCHMVWGGGVLMNMGVLDTAGGLVVETCSGLTALVLCFYIGPRTAPSEEPDLPRGVLHLVGAGLLWVGWLGFNGGSAYTSGGRASTTTLNTFLAGSAGGMAWLLAAQLSHCKEGMMNLQATFAVMGGAVAGLCAATPSSGFVSPSDSVFIGFTAGLISQRMEGFMEKFAHPRGIDDAVAVFPVHGMAGLWGTFMTGVCARKDLGGYAGGMEGNWQQVSVQLFSMAVVSAWTILGTSLILTVQTRIQNMRATDEEEQLGLDTRPHGHKSAQRLASLSNCDVPSDDEEDETSDDQETTIRSAREAARELSIPIDDAKGKKVRLAGP